MIDRDARIALTNIIKSMLHSNISTEQASTEASEVVKGSRNSDRAVNVIAYEIAVFAFNSDLLPLSECPAHPEELMRLERALLFLDTDLECQWPEEPTGTKFGDFCLGCVFLFFTVISLGLLYPVLNKLIPDRPGLPEDVWPFASREEYDAHSATRNGQSSNAKGSNAGA